MTNYPPSYSVNKVNKITKKGRDVIKLFIKILEERISVSRVYSTHFKNVTLSIIYLK
jgi:hypothetical protein